MTFVLINPGAGPVRGGDGDHARKNIAAFVAELGLTDPPVKIHARHPLRKDEYGRYLFMLKRGIRKVGIDMPGLPLDELRNGWTRLYVDGSSWMWRYAPGFALRALYDHDGAIERRVAASERQCRKDIAADHGRCLACNTVLLMEQPYVADDPFEHEYKILCLGCSPDIREERQTWDGAVHGDDRWKTQAHYLVRRQRMAPEVLGAESYDDPEAQCLRGYSGARGQCIRKSKHDGECVFTWKTLERTYVPGGGL